jgi:GH35 family endo-1,4-beta-xylanase
LYLALVLPILPLCVISCTQTPRDTETGVTGGSQGPQGPTILETYKKYFYIGTAGDVPYGFTDAELQLIKDNFNCITPENYLKPAAIHPTEKIWTFNRTDPFVDWCQQNHIAIHGHTLVWHGQTNPWFFEGRDKATVSKRLEDHIKTLVGHYKGKIHSWDVVNEAIEGNSPQGENLRSSNWSQIMGPEFLTLAFKWAHEADPDCKLYYNDYSIENGSKHQSSLALVKRLKADGAPIYGIGIQGHWSSSGLPYAALDKALSDYAELGLKVSISELDITGVGGTVGGQLNQTPGGGPGGGAGRGGGRGRGGAGTAPASGPAPAGMTLINGEPVYFVAAPGRGGVSGGASTTVPTDLVNSIQTAVPDLNADQKAKLATVSADLSAKLAAWQTSSDDALVVVQPQYSAGQLAYEYEIKLQNTVRAQQNEIRDGLINDAEIKMVAVLSRPQAIQWEAGRLNAQLAARTETIGWSKAKSEALVAEYAQKLATAGDKTSLLNAKAAFWRNVVGQLDDMHVAQVFQTTEGGGAGRGGRGAGTPSAAALKAQADAYARLFAILLKHKDTVERVTFWGLNDRRSWRASENPLIFDINNQRKPAYNAIVDAALHPESVPAFPVSTGNRP